MTETAPLSPQTIGNIVTGLKLNLIYVFRYNPYNAPRIAAPTIPPTKPSILFLGLKIGDILCFPINIPVQYAKVSFPHAARNNNTTNSPPFCNSRI